MQTWLLAGLGNPGREYVSTRHNLGVQTVDAWRVVMSQNDTCTATHWLDELRWPARIAQVNAHNASFSIHCFFPLTGMNASGQAVAAYLSHLHLDASNLVVVHDEIELPLGQITLRSSGSAKGHNGVRSIMAALATDHFLRMRLGINRPPPGVPTDQYVLSGFAPAERITVIEMQGSACQKLTSLLLPDAS